MMLTRSAPSGRIAAGLMDFCPVVDAQNILFSMRPPLREKKVAGLAGPLLSLFSCPSGRMVAAGGRIGRITPPISHRPLTIQLLIKTHAGHARTRGFQESSRRDGGACLVAWRHQLGRDGWTPQPVRPPDLVAMLGYRPLSRNKNPHE